MGSIFFQSRVSRILIPVQKDNLSFFLSVVTPFLRIMEAPRKRLVSTRASTNIGRIHSSTTILVKVDRFGVLSPSFVISQYL